MGRTISKIQTPDVERNYIMRQADELLLLSKERIVLLNAGAGYGKTQLLSNYAARCGCSCSWYSLDETDNDLMSFIRNLTRSVQYTLNIKEEDSFQAPALGQEELDILMECLVCWLDERVEVLNVILDDFQEIHNPDIFNLIDVLAEAIGEKLRFFVAEKGALPEFLVNCVESGRAVCIGPEELEFTQAEIELLLEDEVEEHGLAQAAEAVHSYTEGWPIGVVQVLLRLRQRRKKETAEGVKSICETLEISDYIMTRIYKKLSFDIQVFLRETAVLDYMTAPACNRIMGSYNSDSQLRYLINEKLFVQSLGAGSGLYRYHSLFRRFLLSLTATILLNSSLFLFSQVLPSFPTAANSPCKLSYCFLL